MQKDVIVVGSGGAGLSAAITAAKKGLNVLLIEKTEYLGGTTALSGGGLWIPGNSLGAKAGHPDSKEEGAEYIRNLVGDIVREDVLDTFVNNGPAMVDFFSNETEVAFTLHLNEPDYYQEHAGAKLEGRLLDPAVYDGRKMDRDLLLKIRPPLTEFNAPMGFMMSFDDIPHMMNIGKSFESTIHALKLFIRYGMDRLRYPRGTQLTMGNALVARLLVTAQEVGVEMWTNSPMTRLIKEDGRVVGVEVERNGEKQVVNASKAVVLASGGFSSSEEMRKEFIPYPEHHVSFLPEGNTGDGLKSAMSLGAELEKGNHGDAAYNVMSVLHKPDGTLGKYPHVFLDRSKPGCIGINNEGKRFGNEAAANYYKAMHDTGAVPAHLICDHPFIKKFGLGLVFPGGLGLDKLIKAGYIIKGDTLEALAQKIGCNAENLKATCEAHNRYAAEGVDPEFHKGDTPVDRVLGDADTSPNPCLGPIQTGPFYAVQIFPGDGSTTLGLKVNANAEVLDAETDQPVGGLYACGLDMNVLWRGREPSHGSYNGLSMTFGYVIGNHIANS